MASSYEEVAGLQLKGKPLVVGINCREEVPRPVAVILGGGSRHEAGGMATDDDYLAVYAERVMPMAWYIQVGKTVDGNR